MEWFSTWTAWHWLILGFCLLIAEIVISGVFLFWWGLGALVIAGVAMLFPSISLSLLWISFGALSFIFSLLWWKYQHGKDQQDQAQTQLNQRDHAMLGKIGTVQEMGSNGIGRGYFGDTTWRIQGKDLQAGDLIEVESAQGITLLVKKVSEKIEH